jgi:hypothetical protein
MFIKEATDRRRKKPMNSSMYRCSSIIVLNTPPGISSSKELIIAERLVVSSQRKWSGSRFRRTVNDVEGSEAVPRCTQLSTLL